MSGLIASIVTALVGKASPRQLTEAICIGASRGYTLREVRRGRVSMLKAAANASVAREGLMAGLLALSGMTGPPEVFEGGDGLVVTMGGIPEEATIDSICAPPEWAIRQISTKPYPALGTSQAAIAAAAACSARIPGDETIESVEVRLMDSAWTHDYLSLPERRDPKTRETADHSLHFLVAVALLHGEVGQRHYEDRYWEEPAVESLMSKITIVPDPDLGDSRPTFPAEVVVVVANGGTVSEKVVRVPGSPDAPWGAEEIMSKFERIDRVGLSHAKLGQIAAAALALDSASNLSRLTSLIQ